jgi:hypothetical protein
MTTSTTSITSTTTTTTTINQQLNVDKEKQHHAKTYGRKPE